MVYLSNKNLKEKNIWWSLGLNTAVSLLYFGEIEVFLFDTKLTLNFRGEGGGMYIYLALGQ